MGVGRMAGEAQPAGTGRNELGGPKDACHPRSLHPNLSLLLEYC